MNAIHQPKVKHWWNNYFAHEQVYSIVVILILLSGFIFRLDIYLYPRALWLDEASLSNNIIERPLHKLLFEPLLNNQAAPFLYLLIEKLFVLTFGTSEYILRLVPLLSSLTTLILAAQFVRKILGKLGGIFFLSLFAVNLVLIYYAAEAKQYSIDAFSTLLILLSATPLLTGDYDHKKLTKLALIGLFTAWLSHPAMFVLGATGISLLVKCWTERKPQAVRQVILMGILWIVNYTTIYFCSFRFALGNNDLRTFWEWAYMPMPPWSNLAWFKSAFVSIYRPIFLVGGLMISGLLTSVLGLISIIRKHHFFAMALIVTILLPLAASALKAYPFSDRFLIFLYPIIMFFTAAGIQASYHLAKNVHKLYIPLMVLLTLINFPFSQIAYDLGHFNQHSALEDIQPLLQHLGENANSDEPIYVFYQTEANFRYYRSRYNLDHLSFYFGGDWRGSSENYLTEVDKFLGSCPAQSWFLFSNCPTCPTDDEAMIINYLNHLGKRLHQVTGPGARLYLYHFDLCSEQ
ncbi:MAG: hypothetical protein JW750_11515 [Anaerolineaceae bacterium]|nr:hypothetical protein [Anaerolineaceae bacterium]